MIRNPWKSPCSARRVCSVPPPRSTRGQQDQQAYCTYVMEQARAQRNLLRTPTATAGFTQPETGLPMQPVGGASLGLSDVRKAELTMDVARKNCELYKATTRAQQEIQYALPSPGESGPSQQAHADRTGVQLTGNADCADTEDAGGPECHAAHALLAADNQDEAGGRPRRYPVRNYRQFMFHRWAINR